jgi:hypothetical protein
MKDFTDYENANSEMPSVDEILSQKTVHWQYERECRIVQPEPFYSIKNRITAIYLGSRISRDRQALLEKLVPESIPIHTTKINIGKLAVEPHDLLARTTRK